MTNTLSWLKIMLVLGLLFFFSLAIVLWTKTPKLFEYFNQAFCAH